MAIFIKKDRAEILRHALQKLQAETPIKAIGPGSIARAFTEAITTEIHDLYDALDFNMAQSVISTAKGRALDLIGELYQVKRRTITELSTIDKRLGNFYFYIDAPHHTSITIPAGTRVFTKTDSFIGDQLSFVTTDTLQIPVGRTKSFASIKPRFTDSVFTVGIDSLTVHDFQSPPGVLVKSTNPKPIAPQEGYEDDDTYRIRIIKSIRVASSGTVEALRFAALGVFGVRDVQISTAKFGLGSFEIIVTPEDNSSAREVQRNVMIALDPIRPVGVRMFTRLPVSVPMDVYAALIIRRSTEPEDAVLARRARVGVLRYLNTLLPGDTLVYNKLVQAILDSSDLIQDIQFTRYAPNGIETARKNYTPKIEEQITPGRIEITIA